MNTEIGGKIVSEQNVPDSPGWWWYGESGSLWHPVQVIRQKDRLMYRLSYQLSWLAVDRKPQDHWHGPCYWTGEIVQVNVGGFAADKANYDLLSSIDLASIRMGLLDGLSRARDNELCEKNVPGSTEHSLQYWQISIDEITKNINAIRSLEAWKEQYEKRVNRVEGEQPQTELDEYKNKFKQLQGECDDLNRRLDEIRKVAAVLNKARDSFWNKRDKWRMAAVRMEGRISELEKEIDELHKRLAEDRD